MATRKPPPNSSAAPKQAMEVSGVALDNVPGDPVLGTTVPMQEGTAAEPSVVVASALRGAPSAPGEGLSLPVAHIPAAQPVPGTKASSSVTGKLADAKKLVQLGNAAITEGMPRTAWTSVPSLPQDKHSTGTSPPSTSKSSVEPHAIAVLPSQEVTPRLDKATSPPATGASIFQDTGSPMKLATASASPAAGLPGVPPHAAMEGARMAAPPSADPPSAPSAKVTFSSAIIGIGEATEPGTRALSDTGHKASQDPPVDPAQQSPALSAHVPRAALPAAGETLPPSHSVDLGTAGDGLPGANAVTHPQATALAPGTPAMAVDATTAKHIPTASVPALGSAGAELVSVGSKPSARDTAGTASPETKATPVGLSVRLSPHEPLNGPGGPSQGPFVHSMGSLLPQTSSAGPGATLTEADGGGSPPAGPSVATSSTSLSLTVTGGAKPDGTTSAAAAASSSIAANTHLVVVAPSVTPSITVIGSTVGAGDASLNRVTTPASAVPRSALAPHGPLFTLRPSPEATDGTHDSALRAFSPVAEDDSTAEVSSVGHTDARETTATSQSDAGSTTTWADTTLSESGAEGAAPPATISGTHVPVPSTTSTSLATTPATSVFPSNTIPPATSAGRKTFMEIGATTGMPSAMAKATSTSSALSLPVMHNKAGGGSHPVPSPAEHTASEEPTAPWVTLSVAVPSLPLPSLHSSVEEPAPASLSLPGVGVTEDPTARQTSPELTAGATSPTAISNGPMEQAASMSPSGFQTPPGPPAWGEKRETAGNTTAITAETTTGAITARTTPAIAAESTMAITEQTTTTTAAASTPAIAAETTTAITAGTTVAVTAESITAITADSTTTIAAGTTPAITAETTTAIAAESTADITAGTTVTTTERTTTAITAGTTTAITAGTTMAIASGNTTTPTERTTMAITAGTTTAITAESTTAIAAGTITTTTERTTTAITAGTTTAIAAESIAAITAGTTTTTTKRTTTAITAGTTTAITAGTTMAIASGNTTTPTERTTTAITAGTTTAITAGTTTTTTDRTTTAIAAESTTAITAESTTTIAAGTTTTPTERTTTTITAGTTTAIAAESTTAITAESTTTIAAGTTTTPTERTTTTITAGTTTAVTAESTVAVTPPAPVSPAKEAGGLPVPGTMAPGRAQTTTSPATAPAPAFGTQKGLTTAPSTSAHTTAGHKNPAPEPQPTHSLSMPAASLYPFGMEAGDQECIQRTVDFNSSLFKPEIGFPFGMSLRDALYFTDNGQIIFPPTENYVASNPNPPPRGFSGQKGLPMVAAFWDDADFSQGVGTTWYQEYSTLSSTRDPLVRDVEAKIEKYLQTPYTAKWTLKVTWEKAPAYPSRRDDTQTNTYQAVLTTDGSHSFVLLLYQDGGMRWDYTKLAAHNVLIGFSSGDGYAQNNELTQQPPAVKYRPDQHSSAGTDVRGLWIYRLDSYSQVNYRLQCLVWLDTEPAPDTWNRQLPPCPCSQPQAELDPRYRRSRGPSNPSMRMLRTASPSPAGAGVRCLYQDGSLLEGWQERTWSSPTHPTADRELEAFDWCCRHVQKPLFCTRFAEKRPRVSCEGYVPPTPAGAFGDPHMTTLDGLTYTFNGLGDFVLLLASDAQTSFVLQGRTAQTGTAQATNFVAFAAQYISTTTTATVEWTLGSQSEIQVLLNNESVQFSYSQDMSAEVCYSRGVLLVNTSSVTAVFDGAIAISISANSGILSVVCGLPSRYQNSTKGLLGVWDYDPADDFQMPNGTSIPVNSSEEEIYNYGMTWAVGEHSLFAQPLDSRVMNFTPIFLSRLRQENESQYQLAVSQCHGSKECIYDSLSTGDVALGLATQSLTDDFQQKKTALNSFPPVITGNASLTAFRTERVTRQYHATGVGARFVPHLSPELNISENGTLMWEPRGMNPFTVNLEAVGSNNLSALLQLRFTLCSCSRSQECDYSNTITLEGSSLQLAACRCEGGYSGTLCQDPPDPCAQGCFPGVACDSHTGCGPCPPGLTGDGRHCSDIDECAQGTVCQGNATCTNTAGSYYCSYPDGVEGEGLGCGSRSCPEGYCGNWGHCSLHPITCTPSCTCPPPFTDQRCLVAGEDFRPLPSPDLPRRSVLLRVRALRNATVGEVNGTVSAILGSLEVKAFQRNTNITQTTDSDGLTFLVVSEFTYNSRGTVIQFLNEELLEAITSAFNRQRGRREAGAPLLFQHLHRDNVTDLVKLTVDELRGYFPCDLYGYKGYRLHYTGTIGFVCMSPCKTGYCQHGGQCQHLPEGPTCSCLPFSIFFPGGTRCERLAISLAAFLGILLGALALLCLLLAITCLASHLCRRHQQRGVKENFWRPRPFSSLMMAGERAGSTRSHSPGRRWEPQLQAIDPSVQIKIQRPHIRPLSQPPAQP
ncbi:PREDICTED: mucin-4 [Calidris pugnax]|uniref:mucin-4 n=1 Tax=Calidris pugnax TaxID=198806 RepID=UPI00071E025D|nr:PREDICTED: mucin-4 [Calidris pugnax]